MFVNVGPAVACGRPDAVDVGDSCSHNNYMPTVLRVGARELKTGLGTYLNRVRRGERLIVTDRQQPVAELRRIEVAPVSRTGRLARLAALGCITPPSRRLVPFLPIRVMGGPVSVTLLRGREDRL